MQEKREKAARARTALEKKPETARSKRDLSPMLVEAEKMIDRMAEITRETANRAYYFFRERGGDFGKELDDWFKAEREILRPVAVEVKESGDNIIVNAAVPGFKPEEIQASVKDRTLILSGHAKSEEEKKEENVIVRDWKSNHIFRQIRLPSSVDTEKVVARLKDGMLEMTLPKAAEKDATKISVAAG